MKTQSSLPLAVAAILALGTRAFAADNTATPPVPGTTASTDTKSPSAQNNTPRVNPTPNPEPASQPPGADRTSSTVIEQQSTQSR